MKLKHHFIDETNFYFSFYEKQHIPSICKKISFNNTVLTETKNSNNDKLASKIIVLNLVPNYLNLELKKGLYSKKSTHKPGLAVNLSEGFNNIDDYLKTQCSPKLRKVVTRSVKRLESCFNIECNMFYGHISKADCDLLMGKLYNMIENRFKQRSGRNTILRQWDYYMDLAFNGINKKTASLFVIFSNGQPIEISLNFVYDNIMFSYISSYDLDYAKFGLGHINYYKKLDWCIKNKIDLFDVGYGDYDYKRQWANMDYNFETIYVSNKKSVFLQLFAFIHHSKAKLIHYLILKRVNYWIHDTIDKFRNIDKTYVPGSYKTFDANGQPYEKDSLDINAKDLFYLKKPVFDHAYKHQEHIDDLKVYKSETDTNTYIIKGKKSESCFKFNQQ